MATLAIVFKGQDEVGAASKQVASDIEGVGKAADGAKSSGTGFFSGMLQSASGFLAANVIGSITSQIGGFVSDGFAAARDTQQLMAQTETIIKNTGGAAGMSAQQVTDLATSLSDAAGQSLFGDDQIQGAENVLLKYKELKGIIPGVTQLSVDMAQSLGKDPAAAAEFLGRALQKPFDAANKLAKEGVVLTDSQKATLEAFKKTGDVAGAQAFLMEQLNGTYKGSAAAAAGAAGGTVQFKARMGEVAENLATAALPLLNKFGQLLNDYVAPAIESAAKWIGDNLPVAISAATDVWNTKLLPAVTIIATFLRTSLVPIISDLTTWLKTNLPPAIQQVADYWNNTLEPALEKVWQFIQDNVIPIIDTLVGVAFAILKEDIKILAALWVNVLWPALQKVWAFIDKNVIPILASLIVWIKDHLPPTIRTLADLWNNTLLPALSAVWSFIDTKVLPIFEAIGKVINATLVVAFKLIAGTITTTVIPALEQIWKYIDKNIIPVLKDIGVAIYEKAAPALDWLGQRISPIVDFFSNLAGHISDVIGYIDTLAEKISKIKIPSWAGGGDPTGGDSGGGSSGGGSGGGSGTNSTTSLRRASLPGAQQRSVGGGGSGGGGTMQVMVSFVGRDSELLRQMIRVEVAAINNATGARALNRIRTGG
jgi:hypothetical protein